MLWQTATHAESNGRKSFRSPGFSMSHTHTHTQTIGIRIHNNSLVGIITKVPLASIFISRVNKGYASDAGNVASLFFHFLSLSHTHPHTYWHLLFITAINSFTSKFCFLCRARVYHTFTKRIPLQQSCLKEHTRGSLCWSAYQFRNIVV